MDDNKAKTISLNQDELMILCNSINWMLRQSDIGEDLHPVIGADQPEIEDLEKKLRQFFDNPA